MANWWENLTSGVSGAAGAIGQGFGQIGSAILPGLTNWAGRAGLGVLKSNPLTAGMTVGQMPAFTAVDALTGGPERRAATQSFGGPDRLVAPTPDLATPEDPSYFGMSPEELLAYILDSGGGGVDLSGYNAMLGDVASRETALGQRRAEQQAFLASLYDAAEARATSDREALAAAVEAQLASDAERRAAEMALVREGDVNRAAAATAAREALGAPTGPDLTSAAVENVASGIAAGGSVADRDARIREGIARQQLTREIAGLTPMEQMATMQLGNMYEDRLAALASERAAIQAQMTQARSANRGPSPSERIGALQFVSEAFAAPEAPAAPGVLGGLQGISSYYGPQVAADIAGIGDQILGTAFMSTIDPTKAAEVSEVIQTIRQQDPAIDSYLSANPGFTGLVVNYITQAAKGF